MPNFMVVDLSHHNATADFAKAKQTGVAGIIHKASQGTGFADPKYASRRKQALQAGLLWGAYHFATGADVTAQLKFFLATAAPDEHTLVALDFELNEQTPANSMSLAQAKAFLKGIESALMRKAVLYGGAYLKEKLGTANDPYLAQHRLWWAQYSPAPALPATWPAYWLWQYTDGHHGSAQNVPGLGTPDCDTFDGTPDQLTASWV